MGCRSALEKGICQNKVTSTIDSSLITSFHAHHGRSGVGCIARIGHTTVWPVRFVTICTCNLDDGPGTRGDICSGVLCLCMGTARHWYLITSESSVGVMAAWQHVRPLVSRGFIAMSIVSLFLLGLVPLGFVSLFIPLMIWNVLFAFIPFILVTTGKSASDAVWSSKDMVLTRFWGIFGRTVLMILLLQVVTFCIAVVLTIFAGQSDSTEGGSLLANLLNVATSFLVGPFTLAFIYEMYKLIAVPHTAKVPRIWIIVSGIGIVVLVIGVISMISFASTVDWKGVSTRMGSMMNQQGAKRGDRYGQSPYRDDTQITPYDYDLQ